MRTMLIAGCMGAGLIIPAGCSPPHEGAAQPPVAVRPDGPEASTSYESRDLAISFSHAPNRSVGACTGDWQSEAPCLTLNGTVDGEAETFFSLRSFDGPLEQIARDQAGFAPDPAGRWMTTFGRFESVEVESMVGSGWTGMKATVTCGVSDPATGFHAAGGDCLWMVISDGRRSVVAMTDGVHGLDADTAATLQSIRFLTP